MKPDLEMSLAARSFPRPTAPRDWRQARNGAGLRLGNQQGAVHVRGPVPVIRRADIRVGMAQLAARLYPHGPLL